MKLKLDPIATLISASILLIILFGGYLLKIGFDRGLITLPSFSGVPSLSANAYYLTPPVNSFAGQISRIDKDIVTVSLKFTPTSAFPVTVASPTPTPKAVEISYRFKITSATLISQPSNPPIPYHFKKIPENIITANPAFQSGPPSLNPDKLKLNQTVTVYTGQDLRLASVARQPVPAQSFLLPSVINSVTGAIVSISGNKLILNAIQPITGEYSVTIGKDTEISTQIAPGHPKYDGSNLLDWEKLSSADLKQNMTVTVYSTADLSENRNPAAALITTVY